MKKYFMTLLLLGLSLQVNAALTPTGSYTITFSRAGWTETAAVPVKLMTPNPADVEVGEDFTNFSVGGQTIKIFMESVDIDSVSQRFNWYIDSFAQSVEMLGGSGPLTISIAGLNFIESDDVVFMPDVTHIYYVNSTNNEFNPILIPCSREVEIGEEQLMVSRIIPYYDSLYGMPYGSTDSLGAVTATLPDLLVPEGVNWEVSFGMGYIIKTPIPEPITLLTMCLGILAIRKKF